MSSWGEQGQEAGGGEAQQAPDDGVHVDHVTAPAVLAGPVHSGGFSPEAVSGVLLGRPTRRLPSPFLDLGNPMRFIEGSEQVR